MHGKISRFLIPAVLGLSFGCGGPDDRYPKGTIGISYNPRIQRIFASRSTSAIRRLDVMAWKLLSDLWVGVDDGRNHRQETTLRFYDARYNPDLGQYRYQFDVRLGCAAARGVVNELPAANGALRGTLISNETLRCTKGSRHLLEGSYVEFRIVSSEFGPVLEMKLDRPFGYGNRFEESIWNFIERSKVPTK